MFQRGVQLFNNTCTYFKLLLVVYNLNNTTMKPIPRCTLLLGLIICFTTCKKDDKGASATLPEATQEGKNTMGMKINGKVWTPYYACGFYSNPCGAVEFSYNQYPTTPYYFNGSFTRDINKDFTSLTITSLPGATISTLGDKYDSLNVSFTNYSTPNVPWIDYTKSYKPKGNFTVTKIDSINKILSGTFSFTLYGSGDSVVITDGRFDYKFYTCLCN